MQDSGDRFDDYGNPLEKDQYHYCLGNYLRDLKTSHLGLCNFYLSRYSQGKTGFGNTLTFVYVDRDLYPFKRSRYLKNKSHRCINRYQHILIEPRL